MSSVDYHNSVMRLIENMLRKRGYRTELDCLFPKIINRRNGRIDVVGIKPDHKIAIEIESSKRQKTKIKLERCGFDEIIVILLSENPEIIKKQRQFYETNSKIKTFTVEEFKRGF